MSTTRQLAAIMFTDIVGYTTLMGDDSRSKQSLVGSPACFAAAVYTAMGENASAIRWLEQAYLDREEEMYWLKVEPLFRPLHNESGFRILYLNELS